MYIGRLLGRGVRIFDEGAILEHRTDGRFITVVKNVGGSSQVAHCKIVEGHVLFTYDMEDIFVKTEEFRCKLVDLIIGEDGRFRLCRM